MTITEVAEGVGVDIKWTSAKLEPHLLTIACQFALTFMSETEIMQTSCPVLDNYWL